MAEFTLWEGARVQKAFVDMISDFLAAFRWGENLLLVERVVDVAGAESYRWTARPDILPVVVGIGDAQVAAVLIAVVLAVTDEGGLPVVVEVDATGRRVSRLFW